MGAKTSFKFITELLRTGLDFFRWRTVNLTLFCFKNKSEYVACDTDMQILLEIGVLEFVYEQNIRFEEK